MKLAELRLSSTLHGWDPLRIVAQICAIQCIHYILLAAFVPPLLSIFTASAALRFEGGPAQVGMLIDWRELASQPTWDWAKTSTNTLTLAMFLLSTHYSHYNPWLFSLNLAGLLLVLFPKLPILHRLRFLFFPSSSTAPSGVNTPLRRPSGFMAS